MSSISMGPTDQLPNTSCCDLLFVFEFEESFHINSIALRAHSFKDALLEFSIVLGDCALHHVLSIRKLY